MAGALVPLGVDHSYLLDDKASMLTGSSRTGKDDGDGLTAPDGVNAFGTRFVAGRPILTA
jgi:hypothetical protein